MKTLSTMKSGNEEVAETAVKRAVYDKYGKYKYVVKLCNKILEELKERES